jgi:predicted DNA-binding protein (UPF0251 family)
MAAPIHNRTSRARAIALQREHDALELRKAGASYSMIAERLGFTRMAAWKAVDRALQKVEAETIVNGERVLILELLRLDRAQLAITPQVQAGSLPAIREQTHLQERRSRYLGLDAPMRQELTGKDGGPFEHYVRTESELDAEIRGLLGELADRREETPLETSALLLGPAGEAEAEAT